MHLARGIQDPHSTFHGPEFSEKTLTVYLYMCTKWDHYFDTSSTSIVFKEGKK